MSCNIFTLTTFWSRLNTTNSTVTYETGLNSLLAVVDSYQVSSSMILVTPVECHSDVDVDDIDLTLTPTPGGGVEGGSDRGGGRSKSFSHCREPS